MRVGSATALVLGLAGAGLALQREAVTREGRLTVAGRTLFARVAAAVLDGMLPEEAGTREAALGGHMQRLEATIGGFPPAVRAEIAELATLLVHPAGRIALAGLSTDWADAKTAEVQAMLQALRESRWALRQQVYHALRDLTNGAFFSDASTWAAVGYPGPRPVGDTAGVARA